MRAAPTMTNVAVERSGCSHQQFTNVNENHMADMLDVTTTGYWYYNDGYTADAEL